MKVTIIMVLIFIVVWFFAWVQAEKAQLFVVLVDFEPRANLDDNFHRNRILKNISVSTNEPIVIYRDEFWTPYLSLQISRTLDVEEVFHSTTYLVYDLTLNPQKKVLDVLRDTRPGLMLESKDENHCFFFGEATPNETTVFIQTAISYWTFEGNPRLISSQLRFNLTIRSGSGNASDWLYNAPFVTEMPTTEPSETISNTTAPHSTTQQIGTSHNKNSILFLAIGLVFGFVFLCLDEPSKEPLDMLDEVPETFVEELEDFD